ncbi:MAG: UDP-glucose 6-dehydrogenase TuaD, partial [Verrucomicrobiota bacterium]
KKDTNDTRESAAIHVCRDLLDEGARLAIHDPKVPAATILEDLNLPAGSDRVQICADPQTAADGAHAIAILTEWDAFRSEHLDYAQLFKGMEKPAFLFDGRNILNLDAMRDIGFEAHGIGKA